MEQANASELLGGAFVAPESLGSWEGFSRPRSVFSSGLKISSTALFGVSAPDVPYVRLVETDAYLTMASTPSLQQCT